MLLQLEFAEKKGDLEPALKTFHEAVDGEELDYVYDYTNTDVVDFTEILKSESLKDLFYVILVIGNMINAVSCAMYLIPCCYSYHIQGSRSGGAYGFTVTSLDNLRDTRANKPRMTFMHYIVSVSVTDSVYFTPVRG